MSPPQPTAPQRKIYQVSEINQLASAAIENEFGTVWVEGEISGLKRSQPGHLYFSLKDEKAVLNAAFFRGDQRGLAFEPQDGMRVQAQGRLTIYVQGGRYQMVVRALEEAGKGSLQEAFEKLKQKLAEEGLFDESRKKPIPALPQHIGVVTSPTGAAIRDILNVVSRRFFNLHLVIGPVRVQGEGAAQEIASAIDLFNERADMDVIIVTRGGGSLEDLWAFNEEVVARAIARSAIPVISAVGHEIDFTISDFVADLRAPTPSAAAELVVGRKDALVEAVNQLNLRLARELKSRAAELRGRVLAAAGSYVFREPGNLVRQYRQRIDHALTRSQHSLVRRSQQLQQRVDEISLRVKHRTETTVTTLKHELRRLRAQILALSPTAVLDRGYSITWLEPARVLRSAAEVKPGQIITTTLANGALCSAVTEITKGKQHGQGKDGTETLI